MKKKQEGIRIFSLVLLTIFEVFFVPYVWIKNLCYD